MASLSNCHGPAHTVALVRSLPGVVPFALNEEIPLPLKRMLGLELDWFCKLTNYCTTPVTIFSKHHRWINGVERFTLHCHCLNPHSLQCQCAAVMLVEVVRKFFQGCGFNRKFTIYRDMCNYKVSNALSLVGSTLMGSQHYIYIKCSMFSNYVLIRKKVYLGDHVSCVCPGGFYIILVCSQCGPLPSAHTVEKCAKKTRRLILRMYRVLHQYSSFTLYSAEASERVRRKRLRHHAWYRIPIEAHDM